MLCAVGDLLEDVVVHAAAPTVPGTDNPATITRTRGGSAANVAAAAAHAGAPVRFVGKVGADAIGDRLVGALAATGVDMCVQRGGRTGTVVVVVHADGERTMYPDRGAAVELGPIDPAWAGGVTWVHVPAYSLCAEPIGAATAAFVDVVRRAGGRCSVDVSSHVLVRSFGPERFTGLVADLAPDVVFATVEEAASLTAPVGGVLVVKDGPRPVVVRRADGSTDAVLVPIVTGVVDTTGAGDAFAAGMILALGRGAAVAEAVAAGAALAASTLHRAGAALDP